MTTIKKMLISFAAGAVLGILYAPSKGSKTRKKLARVGSNMKEGWNNITDSVADGIDNFRGKVDDIADEAINKVENTQFAVDDKAGYL